MANRKLFCKSVFVVGQLQAGEIRRNAVSAHEIHPGRAVYEYRRTAAVKRGDGMVGDVYAEDWCFGEFPERVAAFLRA